VSPFLFRLDRILQLKEHEEETRARLLADARNVEEEKRDRLAAASERLEDAGIADVPQPGTALTAGAMANNRLPLDAAQRDVEASTAAHREAQDRLTEEEDRFGEARKDRRVLEKLREHSHDHWKLETDRQEQGRIDEVALAQRARKEKGS